ncbi:trypsin-like peptidase domain-containing protein [Streptomyces sp. NY05-11A]|uniref:trypsin-like peptidase domain-containing protein n=1 Tax=Streptomyces soliscabiei TaxID=588897 RepID=UPI0029A08EAD|nr:trypsin-like peptidase domain-containing protein [Streptomyces sp. NY05-11A]MDX2683302.1 serine protease [Streptomyces sp. NY05-11A]
MAGRGPRTGEGHRAHTEPRGVAPGSAPSPDACLVRIRDLAGRPRGTGFVADHHGTVITSHEAVDGLPRLVLYAADDRGCVVTADAVTPLPELDLALVRTEGLGVDPLPVTVREGVEPGRYVRLAAGCWREARVLTETPVTYTATDRLHVVDEALELAIGTAGRDALRLGGGAAGGPVLDAGTGAVVAVLGASLRSEDRDVGFAVPLRPGTRIPDGDGSASEPPPWAVPAPADGPLAELLARNAATVPAYGADLNLAGILELTATSVGSDGPPGALGRAGTGSRVAASEPVERAHPAREFAAFATSPAAVLGLVGAPGSGRTTELAALAARRNRGAQPAPTLWLRGADLRDEDDSLADAARRTLIRAARIVAAADTAPGAGAGVGAVSDTASDSASASASASASGSGRWVPEPVGSGPSGSCGSSGLGDVSPERIARLARAVGRPLLLLLDGPEEMPPVLAHRLAEWTEGTVDWLRETGSRLVVACRGEYWERAGAEFPPEMLYGVAAAGDPLPPCVRLGDLTPDEAREARARYGLPEAVLAAPDARHPLTLRLLSEIRAALPGPPDQGGPVDRDDILAAHLDLMCLRIAVRLAAENGLRGTAVRRLAAKVAGQVHEAARRSLGPGQGELDRASFEAVFPWGPAPARLGGGTGWASAVLTEGLLVPAGTGYRFAHEELADWIQGVHLDLDEALRALLHDRRAPEQGGHPLPVPHHRIGPVVQALLLVARQQGAHQLTARLRELVHALEAVPDSWWAGRLLCETLLKVPDATPYTGVLRLLADRIGAGGGLGSEAEAGTGTGAGAGTGAEVGPGAAEGGRGFDFGPSFWTEIALPPDARLDLLRRLVLADGAPRDAGAPRYLDAVARLLAVDPSAVQPYLTHWFDDERPLPATPHATVATAAQALLHTHRRRALDDLTEVLVDCAHHRADELLAVLAEDEPSALCRAVDRWAHDERQARRVAAAAYGLRAAPHAKTDADRRLLRYAALALLADPADGLLHGGALALLVRDPETRSAHLPQALERFEAGDPQLPPGALLAALSTHPEPVLDAFRNRLSGADPADAGSTLAALADVTTPERAHRVAVLVRDVLERRPESAGHVAAYVDRRLDHGPAARAVLLPLVTGLLDGGPEQVRAALAGVLAAPGAPDSPPLRRELLERLLTREHAPAVLDAVLHGAAGRSGEDLRDLVHRTGLLLVRTPDGATCFDRALVELGRYVPGFAAQVVHWLTDAPGEWAAVVGPSTRRMIENLAGVRVPA